MKTLSNENKSSEHIVSSLLGLNLKGMDLSKLFLPLFELESDGTIFIKFMSDNGVLDEELGERFATHCKRRKVSWTRTDKEQKRMGIVKSKDFPGLQKWLKEDQS